MFKRKASIALLFAVIIFLPLLTSAQSKTATETIAGPALNVPIPTLPSFSNATIAKDASGKAVSASIPWLAEYILAIYKYILIIGSVLAVLTIMVGGFLYSASGANQAWAKKGKQLAFGSLTGLVLLLASYAILYLINPELPKLKSIELSLVEFQDFADATKGFNPPGISLNTHIVCDDSGTALNRSTGKPIDTSKVAKIGNGANFSPNPHQKGIPFYETDHGMYSRKKKPDLIIIHATGGNNFLNASSEHGGPAVHYLIDRNGDAAQLILEENASGSVKAGPISSQANSRGISYEIVNLNAQCGSTGYQTKERRYSGVAPEHISKKHPLCLKVETITPTEIKKTCPCSTQPTVTAKGGFCCEQMEVTDGKEKCVKYCSTTNCWEIYPEEQLQAVAKITAWVAKRYGIPIKHPVTTSPPAKNCPSWNRFGYCWDLSSGIVGHADIQDNTHGDPGPGFDWNHFLSLVSSYYASVPSTAVNGEEMFYKTFGGKPGADNFKANPGGCCLLDGISYPNLTKDQCDAEAISQEAAMGPLTIHEWTAGACK